MSDMIQLPKETLERWSRQLTRADACQDVRLLREVIADMRYTAPPSVTTTASTLPYPSLCDDCQRLPRCGESMMGMEKCDRYLPPEEDKNYFTWGEWRREDGMLVCDYPSGLHSMASIPDGCKSSICPVPKPPCDLCLMEQSPNTVTISAPTGAGLAEEKTSLTVGGVRVQLLTHVDVRRIVHEELEHHRAEISTGEVKQMIEGDCARVAATAREKLREHIRDGHEVKS